MSDQRVVVVTGGGAGIGAAIAEELGRRGDFVVTMDPLVTLDGTATLPPTEDTTAGRIVAAGGSARASATSVTDAAAVRDLFEGLVAELGRLDAVVNVAGITRPSSFGAGTEDDWLGVLAVHLDGYRNVLEAALPIMAAAGRGRILGVTSGSGWRPADAGAYSRAKRAVAALTWQLGRSAPPGVVVNAISPIAVTRMVTAALERAQAAAVTSGGPGSATGGLALGSMPEPEHLAPLAAHLVGDDVGWCSGQVVFAGGAEVAVVEPPRLLEVVRTGDVASLAHVVDTFAAGALVAAEAHQGSGGGSNPRFPAIFDDHAGGAEGAAAARSCLVVADRPEVASAVAGALEARGASVQVGKAAEVDAGFAGAAAAVAAAGPIDSLVVALAGLPGAAGDGWEGILASHTGIVGALHADAAWARAAADHAAASGGPIRLVSLTDAVTSGGRSRAQAAAQQARVAAKSTSGGVTAFSIAIEDEGATAIAAAAELAAHLVAVEGASALAGAELAVGDGWLGLRSHPRPSGSITIGGPELPPWFDDRLRDVVEGR